MQAKLKNKWECYKETEGTTNKMIDSADKANQERLEETVIKIMIEKFGILPFELLNQAKENLYLDFRGENMTINERLKLKEQVDDYFEQLPANVRKNYDDNKQLFYEQIITGEFEQLVKDNIFTQEQAENYTNTINSTKQKIDDMSKQIEMMKGQINEYEKQTSIKENSNVLNG